MAVALLWAVDASDRGAGFFAAFVIGSLMLELPEAGACKILSVNGPSRRDR